jgi:uncharacterized protein YjeT (DUF2065 family)
MAWSDLFTAFALYLVLEGILPFLSPPALRKTMQAFIEMDDAKLRVMGFGSMLAGAVLLFWIRN